MKRHEIDMLNGPIWNKLPRYALPVAATGILEQLFNASDIAVVGKFSAANATTAVAAVGANSPVIGLILNFFIGISLGANVVIANAVGHNDRETVHKAVHTAIVLALAGGLLVTLLGELLAGTLLSALQVPGDVFPYALLYLRIYLLGMPVILLPEKPRSALIQTKNWAPPWRPVFHSSDRFRINCHPLPRASWAGSSGQPAPGRRQPRWPSTAERCRQSRGHRRHPKEPLHHPAPRWDRVHRRHP